MLTFHTRGCILITPQYVQVGSGVFWRRLCAEHCACLSVAVSHPQLCSIFGRPRQGWSLPSQNVVYQKWQDDSGAVLESLVNSDAVLTAFAKQVSE